MTVDIGRYGVWTCASEATPAFARLAEDLGYTAFWIGGSPPGDLELIERILDKTDRIAVATGIVNMWKDDATVVGESYLRIAERHADRFLLGVGVGHPEATSEYQKPMDKVRSYLATLDERGVPKHGMILAALGPLALRVSAERTAGAHPYITTPRHTRLAREIIGEGVLLAPEQKIMLTTDVAEARERIRSNARRYLGLTNYHRSFLREGWSEEDLSDGGSDELIDLLGLHGTVHQVAAGLQAHFDAGADHVGIQALGDDPADQLATLAGVIS